MSIPGIGIILTKNTNLISYRYLPFSQLITKEQIDKALTDDDKKMFANIRFDSHWIFEISRESYLAVTENMPIRWP